VANSQLDIEALARTGKYRIAVTSEESEADADARRREAAEKAKHGRRIQFWSFVLTSLCVLASFFYCGYVLATGSPDDKKLAAPIATAIVTGLVSGLAGFAVGQKAG
jgi:heme/copper-type cytochrome/quinol oxidase subunit 3